MHDVSHADQTRMRRESLQLRFYVICAHINPADHAADEVGFSGEFEQEFSFAQVLPRLHRHCAVDAVRPH